MHDERLLDRVLAETHMLWARGLAPAAWHAHMRARLEHPWGESNIRLLPHYNESGDLLAACFLYRLDAVLDGAPLKIGGIGGVYVVPEHRGHGHGHALLAHAESEHAKDGRQATMLFSEIGPEFYSGRGYRPLRVDCFSLDVPSRWPSQRATRIGEAQTEELPQICAIHRLYGAGARLRMEHEPLWWSYQLMRARDYHRRIGRETVAPRILVKRGEGDRVDAYAYIAASNKGATLLAYGARPDAQEEPLGPLMAAVFTECNAAGARRLGGLAPPSFAQLLPKDMVRFGVRDEKLLMVKRLRDSAAAVEKLEPWDALIFETDAF